MKHNLRPSNHLIASVFFYTILVLLIFPTVPSIAGNFCYPVAQGPEFQVNPKEMDESISPAVAVNEAGKSIIVWHEGYSLYAQLYDAEGCPTGELITVFEHGIGFPLTYDKKPDVAMNNAGGFVVTWRDAISGDWYTFYRVFDAMGNGGDRLQASMDGSYSFYSPNPKIQMDGQGRFVIVWEADIVDDEVDDLEIYARRFEKNGSPLGAEFIVNSITAEHQSHPDIGMADDGSFVIVWQGYHPVRLNDIYARPFAVGGTPTDMEFLVNASVVGEQKFPTIGMNGHGQFVVSWKDEEPDLDVLRAQIYAANTSIIGFNFDIDEDAWAAQSVAMNNDGNFWIVWSADQRSTGLTLYATYYNSVGSPIINQFSPILHNTNGIHIYSDVAMNSAGTTVMVWNQSIGQDIDHIFARRFECPEREAHCVLGYRTPELGDNTLVNTTIEGGQQACAIASDGNTLVAITWADVSDIKVRLYSYVEAAQSGEILVAEVGSAGLLTPDIGMDADGGFIVVWPDNDQGGVFARRYDEDGNPLGGVITVASEAGQSFSDPAIAVHPDGNFVITWVKLTGTQTGEVYMRTFDAVGNPTSVVTPITNSNIAYRPDVAINIHSEFIVVWERKDGGADGTDIYAQQYHADGTVDGLSFRVHALNVEEQTAPAIAMDKWGNFTVVWQQAGVGSNLKDIYYRSFSHLRTALTSDVRLYGENNEVGVYPAIAMTPDGNFAITFTANSSDTNSEDIMVQRLDYRGNFLGEFLVNAYTPGIQSYPDVAIAKNGTVLLSWNSLNQEAFNSNYDVYLQSFTCDDEISYGEVCNAGEQEFLVNQYTPGEQEQPAVASGGQGSFVVAWSSMDQEDDEPGYGLYAHIYDANCEPLTDEIHVSNDYPEGDQWRPSVAMEADGDFVVVWEDAERDGDEGGVFGRRYNADGTPKGGSFIINSSTGGAQTNPDVAVLDDGSFVVVWEAYSSFFENTFVIGQRFNSLGNRIAGEFIVHSTYVSSHFMPAIDIHTDGSFIVTWAAEDDEGEKGVYFQRFGNNGSKLDATDTRVSRQFALNDNINPDISIDNQGNFSIVWQYEHPWANVNARRYDNTGQLLDDDFLISNTAYHNNLYSRNPVMAMNGEGTMVISWERTSENILHSSIATEIVTPGETGSAFEFRTNALTTTHIADGAEALQPAVTFINEYDFVIVWAAEQEAGGNKDIYANTFAGDHDDDGHCDPDLFVLPLDWLTFEATLNKAKHVELHWETANEKNTDYFIVERSLDGKNFEAIDKVLAAGNSTLIERYTSLDAQPKKGINYYRLQQIDMDGAFSYSKVVSVTLDIREEYPFSMHPNPVDEVLYINFQNVAVQSIRLIDSQGRILQQLKVTADNAHSFQMKAYPPGIYFVQVATNQRVVTQKVVKQ